jgi:hypothetical protein
MIVVAFGSCGASRPTCVYCCMQSNCCVVLRAVQVNESCCFWCLPPWSYGRFELCVAVLRYSCGIAVVVMTALVVLYDCLQETKLVVPPDQVKLTAKQLDEDVTRCAIFQVLRRAWPLRCFVPS